MMNVQGRPLADRFPGGRPGLYVTLAPTVLYVIAYAIAHIGALVVQARPDPGAVGATFEMVPAILLTMPWSAFAADAFPEGVSPVLFHVVLASLALLQAMLIFLLLYGLSRLVFGRRRIDDPTSNN